MKLPLFAVRLLHGMARRVPVFAVPTLLLAHPTAAQWVEAPRQGWVSVTAYHQDTRHVYDVDGDEAPFPGSGRSVSTQVFATVATGLLTSVDAWVQIPFQRLRYDDVQGRRTSTGFGDARLYLRWNPFLVAGVSLPVALRGGAKLPIGDFDVGSSLIPLGDGQRDWELMLEVGKSFFPRPLYVMGWAGYRWREAKEVGRLEFGDERFFYAAVGGDREGIGGKLAVDGWVGDTPIFNGVRAEGAEREMFRVNASLLLDAGPGQIEIGARYPLSGKNLPSGWDLVLGYFSRFEFP